MTMSPSPPNPPVAVENPTINLNYPDGSAVVFGDYVIGKTPSVEFSIANTSNVTLTVSNIETPEGFSLSWNSGDILANTTQNVVLSFIPTEEKTYSGVINVESNAESGTSTLSCSGTGVNSIYPTDIQLDTQEEVDDFGDSGYTEVNGKLYIGNENNLSFQTSITDLTPLMNITKVKYLFLVRNASLQNLQGLNQLQEAEVIQIYQNDALEEVDALSSITVLSGNVAISDNPLLKNINGFSGLTSIQGGIFIRGNSFLENIDGFSNVELMGTVFIKDNPLIRTLNGLSNVTEVPNNITITNNQNLFNYCGIQSLIANAGLGGQFDRLVFNRYNPYRSEIEAGNCSFETPLGVYHGDLHLANIQSVDLFSERGYESIDGYLRLSGTPTFPIDDLSGFSSLKRVSGYLAIEGLPITNLNGLNNLISVGDYLRIANNDSLADFCGIVPLMQDIDEGLSGAYVVQGNVINPSQMELENGVCQ